MLSFQWLILNSRREYLSLNKEGVGVSQVRPTHSRVEKKHHLKHLFNFGVDLMIQETENLNFILLYPLSLDPLIYVLSVSTF